jgi:4-oxalomesaconate tautomerase
MMNGSARSGIRCMLMRGGTSRGLYLLASDLPDSPEQCDRMLLSVMGSGHPLQIDGVGGAHPLTSKVAVVSSSQRDDAIAWSEAERARGKPGC